MRTIDTLYRSPISLSQNVFPHFLSPSLAPPSLYLYFSSPLMFTCNFHLSFSLCSSFNKHRALFPLFFSYPFSTTVYIYIATIIVLCINLFAFFLFEYTSFLYISSGISLRGFLLLIIIMFVRRETSENCLIFPLHSLKCLLLR